MPNMTINEAIITVLKSEKKSLSSKEIYDKIIERKLYFFKSATPHHIVLTQLRRHCIGVDFKSAHKEKHYVLNTDNKYGLKK